MAAAVVAHRAADVLGNTPQVTQQLAQIQTQLSREINQRVRDAAAQDRAGAPST